MSAPSIDSFLAALDGVPVPGAPGTETAVARVVREYAQGVRDFLGDLHGSGASGLAVNELHSDLMDQLVRRLFALAEESYFGAGGEEPSSVCLLAVGGYGRREMNLHSDVDLLFLYGGALTPHIASVAERVQYWLWDANLTVGGATRTIDETISLALEDVTVRTGLMETRFLVGSGQLFQMFSEMLRSKLFVSAERFIEGQVEAMHQRHERFGDSLYLLQPNLKEGAGGLRDYHVAYWSMQAAQPQARGRDDFLHLGFLTEPEIKEYREALDYLWRIRNELHLISGRKNDQMSFELQERIAVRFGYVDSGDQLPVEQFMGDYYRHARAVENYSSLVVEQCLSRVRRRATDPPKDVEDGFRIVDGQLEVPHTRMFRERPLRLLSVFRVAQDHDVSLTRKARRLVRENLHLIDDEFRSRREVASAFFDLLDSERRVMRSLMAMNEAGLLGTLIPEWDDIVCRWQHVMYHTYTVDVHSIFLVEELRRLWRGKYEGIPELTDLMKRVDDRPVLFLGCLLHDIGKGSGVDHSAKGAERARTCLERLGLEPDRTDRVVFLVRHHLLMSHLAQRRDLSDPKLILEFARTVGDRTNLRNLYLITFADVRASSNTAWTEWKGQLLRELFERTAELLETGADDRDTAMELIEARVETRIAAATAELEGLGVGRGKVEAYIEMMPRRYFTAHTPRQIARHALVSLGLGPDRKLVTAFRTMGEGFTEFILCTFDVQRLYSNVAGVLTAHGLNILGSHVYTTRTGLALEVYRLTTPPGGGDEHRIAWRELEGSLESVLSEELSVVDLLRRRGPSLEVTRAPSSEPPAVFVSNDESDFYTIVDVATNDRVGLLYDLTRTIAEHGLEIYISKAATIMDQVTDTFYLKDGQGKKVADSEALGRLHADLLAAARDGADYGGR
ncbi:MAG: [protein-PII] uridylyltransferase [Myxococcota bacterium]